MDYVTDTRDGYRSQVRAASYKAQQTESWGWARFTTWRERQALTQMLRRYRWSFEDCVLDMPCGTGVLAGVVRQYPFYLVAADMSLEMMAVARDQYHQERLRGVVQADITATPFRTASFRAVIVLGLLHRMPPTIRRLALTEAARVSSEVVIASYSVQDRWQTLKRRVLQRATKSYRPAPQPVTRREINEDIRAAGLVVREAVAIASGLSSEVLFLLEKDPSRP